MGVQLSYICNMLLNIKDALRIMKTGKIFSVKFITRADGSPRTLVGRMGVKRYIKKKPVHPKTYDAAKMGLLVVFDLDKMAYRSVPIDSIVEINGTSVTQD